MLIVFLAVPALQRNSRNNARNSDASRIVGAMTTCLANRNNQFGSCLDDGDDANNNNDIKVDTLSEIGEINFGLNGFFSTLASATFETDTAYILLNAKCNSSGSGVEALGGGNDFKRFTVTWQNENGINRCLQG